VSVSVSRPDAFAPARPGGRVPRLAGVYRVEARKLAAQLGVRVLALVCLLGPFVFVGVLKLQSGSPADTLYGVWVHSSGFAVSIVVLAFASAWGFPLIAGIVAGDLFSSEDRYGTWKTVLTRSRVRGEVFAGKVLAAATFVAGMVALTAASSLVAGALIVGAHPLVSLSGTEFSPLHALGLVLAAWLWCLVPALAFTGLAVLLSVATRNGIMGVVGPGLATLVMQLLLLVGTGYVAHMLLLSAAFDAWPPLLSAHPFLTPLLAGLAVSLVWGAAFLAVAWEILRGRDFAGAPVARRAGWASALQALLGLAVVVAVFAVAGNWGPVGVTAGRLQSTLTPAFDALTLLQQRELGRAVPPGAHLNVLPSCAHRGSTNHGPGDWVCTLNVMIPQPGADPFNPTPVSYDVSVSPDGCYKAQSPPAFIGQQLMRDAGGHDVVNPLYTIYGCLDLMR
jgi:ABC-2 type transport system permease protein